MSYGKFLIYWVGVKKKIQYDNLENDVLKVIRKNMHLLYNRNFSKSKFVLGKFYCTLIKFSLITKRKP